MTKIADIEDQYQDFQNRLFKALLEKQILTDKLEGLDAEIKALRNLIAGMDLARTKPSPE